MYEKALGRVSGLLRANDRLHAFAAGTMVVVAGSILAMLMRAAGVTTLGGRAFPVVMAAGERMAFLCVMVAAVRRTFGAIAEAKRLPEHEEQCQEHSTEVGESRHHVRGETLTRSVSLHKLGPRS